MLILELALAAFLTTKGTTLRPPEPAIRPIGVAFGSELAQVIKTDIESISGPGSVDISIDHDTLFSVRVAVPSYNPEICTPIYDRELKLYRFFPELNFDFYLRLKPDSPEQARH